MNQDKQKEIDQTEYWDVKILDFQTSFFGDEVSILIYNDEETSWKISFLSCYKVYYETDATWRTIAHVRDMKKPQLGYYGQEISLRKDEQLDGFYDVTIDLTILTGRIVCKEIIVEKVFNNSLSLFWQ